jgi:hypothetical protein
VAWVAAWSGSSTSSFLREGGTSERATATATRECEAAGEADTTSGKGKGASKWNGVVPSHDAHLHAPDGWMDRWMGVGGGGVGGR